MAVSFSLPQKKCKSVLIVTSSGGGGLIQTANAKTQEVLKEDLESKIIRKDLLMDLNAIGNFAINVWNKSQRNGNVKVLEIFIFLQKFAEIVLWPKIFVWIFSCLIKENIDRVIDTQPLGTSAIVKAIRFFNFIKKKKVLLEKVIVDLPTNKATHYFRTIKRLSSKDKNVIRVVTIPPLLEKGETSAQFWQRHCGMSESKIAYQEYFIREGFHPYQKKMREINDYSLQVHFKNPEEFSLMQKTYQKGAGKAKILDGSAEFLIKMEDLLITILLGSQPAFEGTIGYVKRMLEIASKMSFRTKKCYIFAFCSDHYPGQDSLYRRLQDLIVKMEDYPANFVVVPISFQDEKTIASLFFRSDASITRSGGQTSMELMGVMKGQIWIHSEAKKVKSGRGCREDLLKGIPGWEAGNACYLEEKRGAKIITPDYFEEDFRNFLQKYAHRD